MVYFRYLIFFCAVNFVRVNRAYTNKYYYNFTSDAAKEKNQTLASSHWFWSPFLSKTTHYDKHPSRMGNDPAINNTSQFSRQENWHRNRKKSRPTSALDETYDHHIRPKEAINNTDGVTKRKHSQPNFFTIFSRKNRHKRRKRQARTCTVNKCSLLVQRRNEKYINIIRSVRNEEYLLTDDLDIIRRRNEFHKRLLEELDVTEEYFDYKHPFWDHPYFTTHYTSGLTVVKDDIREQEANKEKKDFFINSKQTSTLPTPPSLSNIGITVFSLAAILSLVALGILFLNDGKVIPFDNEPNIDIPGLISSSIYSHINTATSIYNTIKEPFKGYEDNLVHDQDAFMCPIDTNNLKTIVKCAFFYLDAVILNTMEAIPSYGSYFLRVARDLVGFSAPEHFVVDDAINMALFLVQKFVVLPKVVTLKPNIIVQRNTTEEDTRTKASFKFDPFPEDVVSIRDTCLSQCKVQASATESFIFTDVGVQSTTFSTPMTIRDYIFNSLGATTLYVCQYTESENFGATWLYFIDECLCSDSCSTSDYFGFTGCADLLNRVGVSCSSATPCTLDRLCPYPSRRLQLTSTDQSSALYDHINTACLDVCAELAFGVDFATLVTLSTVGGALSTNLFGLLSNPFGTEFGVPLSFIPVGGLVGISFASSGLSQIIRNDNGDFEIYPNGTMPIAAFLTNSTQQMPNVNATTVTFAETVGSSEPTSRFKRAVDQEFLKNKLSDIQTTFEDINTLTISDWSSNFGDNIYHGFEKINKTYLQIKKDKQNKKTHSLDVWLKTAQQDLKRLANLIVTGKFKEIVSPSNTTNNYQNIVNYSNKVFESTLRNTLNATIQDIGRLALEVPKNITKNVICFKPNILRFWREHQAKQRQMSSEEQIVKSMRIPGVVRRGKRSTEAGVTNIIGRISRGFYKIVSGYVKGVSKGMQNIVQVGRISTSAIDGIVKDVIEDVDRRVNHGDSDDEDTFFEDEDEDEDDENVLNQYCFEDLYAANFGFRSLLEYEKECEEGSECQQGLDAFADEEDNEENFAQDKIDERHDHYNFPYEFSRPDEYFYNLSDEDVDNLNQLGHLNVIDAFMEKGQSSFPSLKPRFIRSVIDRQTGERFQTVRKRCRRVSQGACGSRAASRLYDTDQTASSFKKTEIPPIYHDVNNHFAGVTISRQDTKIIERQGIALPILGVPFVAAALPAAGAAAIGIYGSYGDEIASLFNSFFSPCSNLVCANNTDTCKAGACQCGDALGFTCDTSSQLPRCSSGACACSKTTGTFDAGDGTTQGTCLLSTHKCQSTGECIECNQDSQCYGISDRCISGRCVCGSNGAVCNPSKSSACTDGVCKCGANSECASTESIETLATCSSSSCYYDATTTTCLMQRSADEVCELVSDKYNPIYVPNNPVQATLTCDDNRGSYKGTYQCLAPIHRCRNRGGHDISSCSTDALPSSQRDLVCGAYKAYVRYCHISALNDPSSDSHFEFTNYPYFTADSAHTTCAEIGGTVPSIRLQHEEIWLETMIEYLSSMVRFNRPYTLKYISWPFIWLDGERFDRFNPTSYSNPSYRWDRGSGEDISSQTKTFWQSNEPNVQEFDYSQRSTSPIAKEAATRCGVNPTFACSVSESFSCDTTNSLDGTLIVNPSNKIDIGHGAMGTTSCPNGQTCQSTGIFVDFDLIRSTTEDASPACVAMYGPDIKSTATSSQANTCDLLFEDHTTSGTLLGKWTDLKCNQRTRSLMCNLGQETIETSTCPTTHPYAFSGGRECCKTQKEANGVARKKRSLSREPRHPHANTEEGCNGSVLDLESICCENGALIRCPAGDGKLCSDGSADGVLKCKPSDSTWAGYSEGCCSSTNHCGNQQGGCTSNDQCSGQLVCGSNANSVCGTGFDASHKCCHYPVCGTTCTMSSSDATLNGIFGGTYLPIPSNPPNPDSNGQIWYYKCYSYPTQSDCQVYFIYLFFTPETNSWNMQLSTFIGAFGEPAMRLQLQGSYNDNAYCVGSVSGSNWELLNPNTGQYVTDTTMTITCT